MMGALKSEIELQVSRALVSARSEGRPVLVCVSAEIPFTCDPLALLARSDAQSEHRFSWERPADGFAFAGIGAAVTLTARGPKRFAEISAAWRSALYGISSRPAVAGEPAFPLLVGGFAFDSESAQNGDWRGFPPARLVAPRVTVVREAQSAHLCLTAMVRPEMSEREISRRMVGDLALLEPEAVSNRRACEKITGSAKPVPITPDDEWVATVSATIADIGLGRLEKLVLARACAVEPIQGLDPVKAARRLRDAYPSCVTFLVGSPDGIFMGATPETLARLEGRRVTTAAVAGSAPRGKTPASDALLARAMMRSKKERNEQAIVVRAIERDLTPLCEKLMIAPGPRILRLRNVQHLTTPIAGRLSENLSILDLVERLHPSPAVAGFPRETAVALLREREPFDRGWYAGPVGWIDARGSGEFAVAIRSALIRGARAVLYAGSGIVAGSDPKRELAETRLKLEPLLSAFLEAEP